MVRGGPVFGASAYRPGAHTAPLLNAGLARQVRDALDGTAAVVLQGSVTGPHAARDALAWACVGPGGDDPGPDRRTPACMARLRRGHPEQVRPCLLCNQACRVRDPRNPLVSCVGDPRSGHETEDPPEEGHDPRSRDVLVVGGRQAGLEAARVLAGRGHRVRLAGAGPGAPAGRCAPRPAPRGRERLALLADSLEDANRRRLGVRDRHRDRGGPGRRGRGPGGRYRGAARDRIPAQRRVLTRLDPLPVLDPLTLLAQGLAAVPDGPVVVDDPVGGPAGVTMAGWLAAGGRTVTLVTPDPVAGSQLSLAGNLAGADTGRAGRGDTGAAVAARHQQARTGRCWKTPGPGSGARSAAPRSWTAVTGWPRPRCTTP